MALAHTKNLFYSWDDYEDFSHTYAADLYIRLTNPRQDFTYSGGLKPIKSILNYIKGSIYFAAVDYRNNTFSSLITPEHDGEEAVENVAEYLEEDVRSQYRRSYAEIVAEYFDRIGDYIDRVAEENSIFSGNSVKSENLKISMLLSIRNFVSLSYNEKLKSEKQQDKILSDRIAGWRNCVVSWDDTPVSLVALYVQKVFELLEKDIEIDVDSDYVPDDVVKSILESALPTYGLDQTEDS